MSPIFRWAAIRRRFCGCWTLCAAVMGMNNIYYRFLHLSSNEKYGRLPAKLRMNALRTHGVDPLEKVVREKGVSEETILGIVRIASVVHAVGSVLDAERAAVPA